MTTLDVLLERYWAEEVGVGCFYSGAAPRFRGGSCCFFSEAVSSISNLPSSAVVSETLGVVPEPRVKCLESQLSVGLLAVSIFPSLLLGRRC